MVSGGWTDPGRISEVEREIRLRGSGGKVCRSILEGE